MEESYDFLRDISQRIIFAESLAQCVNPAGAFLVDSDLSVISTGFW